MLITIMSLQLSIEKIFYVKFVEGFSGLFCIGITWHYSNLNVKCFFLVIPPEIYSKEVKKPSLRLKLFLAKR